MKDLGLLVFLSQLGLSVALPLVGFVLLGVWLHQQFSWGAWVIIVSTVLGLVFALDGLKNTLKAMEKLAKNKKNEPPAVAFNDHD